MEERTPGKRQGWVKEKCNIRPCVVRPRTSAVRPHASEFGPNPLAHWDLRFCDLRFSVPGLGETTDKRDYARGAQFILQRRSANRLSGWIGYTLLAAREREYQIAVPFPPFSQLSDSNFYYSTLEDQRHSLSVFATYRLRPTLNLSGKFLYGSGYPVPSGTFAQIGNGQFVSTGINTTRLSPYQRLDVRTDKDWAFQRWKLTLYGEVLNLTNHYNARFAYESGIDPNTGKVLVKTLQGLPVTPTVGVAAQF